VLVDGDRVAVRWTSSGTHTGPFMGAEPTGRAVSHWAVVIYRLQDGKVVEMWPMVDRLGMMRQLGVVGV
jgi:predicted ester cyclase